VSEAWVIKMVVIGKHIVAELYKVRRELISHEDKVREIVERVIKEAGLTKIGSVYKQFKPYGVTAVVLISESHISIHTWPELETVNLDIFTCGDQAKTDKAFKLFLKHFSPEYYKHYELTRG
jgi:S-adenosylmethionine decarboxylase